MVLGARECARECARESTHFSEGVFARIHMCLPARMVDSDVVCSEAESKKADF